MAKKEDQEEGKDITQEKNTVDQNDSGKEETTEVVQERTLEDKFNELNDKYLRLYSDFDNFRKRTTKEKADSISNANAGVLKDLLTVLDDFERAIQSNENTEDVNGLKEGFQLIYNKFNGILASKGLKPMDSKGTPFDLDLHEAITNVPVEREEEKGKVIDVVEKGYYLHEKVIRYAKVVVGQ